MKTRLLIATEAILCIASAYGQAPAMNDSMPARWVMERQYYQSLPTDDKWWVSFHDAVLTRLIERAEEANYDIRMASRRIELARLGMLGARSGYYPTLTASGGWETSRMSGAVEGNNVPASKSSEFRLGVDMNWEIDIFGKVNAGVKAKKASWQASRMEFDAALVSVAANVAQYYFQLREYQAILKVLRSHVESQKEVVRITEVRFDTGLSSLLDVSQAKTVLYSTEAQIPAMEGNIEACINSISLLLNTYPEEIREWLNAESPLPDYSRTVAVGVPAELLRRRPDVVQAEYELAAQAAQIGIAKKDFLPVLSISGSIGTESKNIGHLFHSNSFSYSVGPTLTWTIFDGLSRNYALKEAQQQMEIALDDYNLSISTAVHEVNGAMIQYSSAVNQIGLLEKVVQESKQTVSLSMDLYKDGLSPFSDVMNAMETYLGNETSLTQAKGEALIDLVNLYKALGGGWELSDK